MRYIILFITTILTAIVFSAQFEIVRDVESVPGDISAQKYPYKDVNGEWCAILKIYTDIQDLNFKSFGYEKHDYRDGTYLVYMQPDSKNLTFIKDGLTTKNYNFPYRLRSNTVYSLEIKAVGEEKKIEQIAVTIQTDPKGAKIILDEKEKADSEKIVTSPGKHRVYISFVGYQPVSEEIVITPKDNFFSYKLEKIRHAEIVVKSNPEGVSVYIAGSKVGVTPFSTFYPEGNYTIKFSGDDVEEKEEEITIVYPKTEKTFQLKDIRGTLTINTHEKAKVLINGKEIVSFKNIKLSPMSYRVRVEMGKREILEESIVIRNKDNIVLDMYPNIKTGLVQVGVIPSDAIVELSETDGIKYGSKGSKIFMDVPTGSYTLTISKSGYKTYIKNIKVDESVTVNETGIKLELIPAVQSSESKAKEFRAVKFASVTVTDTTCIRIDRKNVDSPEWREAIVKANKHNKYGQCTVFRVIHKGLSSSEPTQLGATKLKELTEVYDGGGGGYQEVMSGEFVLFEHINGSDRRGNKDPVEIGHIKSGMVTIWTECPELRAVNVIGDVIISPFPESDLGRLKIIINKNNSIETKEAVIGPIVVGGPYGTKFKLSKAGISDIISLPPGEYKLLLPNFNYQESRWDFTVKKGNTTVLQFDAKSQEEIELESESFE